MTRWISISLYALYFMVYTTSTKGRFQDFADVCKIYLWRFSRQWLLEFISNMWKMYTFFDLVLIWTKYNIINSLESHITYWTYLDRNKKLVFKQFVYYYIYIIFWLHFSISYSNIWVLIVKYDNSMKNTLKYIQLWIFRLFVSFAFPLCNTWAWQSYPSELVQKFLSPYLSLTCQFLEWKQIQTTIRIILKTWARPKGWGSMGLA